MTGKKIINSRSQIRIFSIIHDRALLLLFVAEELGLLRLALTKWVAVVLGSLLILLVFGDKSA